LYLFQSKAKYLAEGVEEKLDVLENHQNEEIATKAMKIKTLLKQL